MSNFLVVVGVSTFLIWDSGRLERYVGLLSPSLPWNAMSGLSELEKKSAGALENLVQVWNQT